MLVVQHTLETLQHGYPQRQPNPAVAMAARAVLLQFHQTSATQIQAIAMRSKSLVLNSRCCDAATLRPLTITFSQMKRPRGMKARSFKIDPAQPSDVPEILGLIRELADYENLASLCQATEEDIGSALFASPPAAEVLVARTVDQTAKAAGFALFFETFSTFLGRRGVWLEDLFVRREYRGAGLGKELLIAVAAIAVTRGCARFEWSVLDWNTAAIGFYERVGAVIMPDWRIARVTGDALQQLAGGSF